MSRGHRSQTVSDCSSQLSRPLGAQAVAVGVTEATPRPLGHGGAERSKLVAEKQEEEVVAVGKAEEEATSIETKAEKERSRGITFPSDMNAIPCNVMTCHASQVRVEWEGRCKHEYRNTYYCRNIELIWRPAGIVCCTF